MKFYTPFVWAGVAMAFAAVLDMGNQPRNAHDGSSVEPVAGVFDRAPDSGRSPVDRAGVALSIDGKRIDVLRVKEIREAGEAGREPIGYLIQTALPTAPVPGDRPVFDVTVVDRDTGEKEDARLQLLRLVRR